MIVAPELNFDLGKDSVGRLVPDTVPRVVADHPRTYFWVDGDNVESERRAYGKCLLVQKIVTEAGRSSVHEERPRLAIFVSDLAIAFAFRLDNPHFLRIGILVILLLEFSRAWFSRWESGKIFVHRAAWLRCGGWSSGVEAQCFKESKNLLL